MGEGATRHGQAFAPAGPLTTGSMATLVVGLSFHWQYLRNANVVSLFSDGSASQAFSGGQPSWFWAFYAAALAAGLALAASARTHGDARVAGMPGARARLLPGASLGTGLLASALLLAVILTRLSGEPGAAMSVVASCLFGVSLAVLTAGWVFVGARMARRDLRRTIYCICTSSLLSLVVSFGLFTLSPVPGVFRALVPLASSAFLAGLLRRWAALGDEAPTCGPEAEASGRDGLLALCVALLCVVVCVKGVNDVLLPGDAGDEASGLYLKHFITVAELVVIMLVSLMVVELEKFAFLGWVILTGGLVTGLVSLSLPDSDTLRQVGQGTIAAARTCLEVFLFALVVARRALGDERAAVRGGMLALVVPDMAACLLGYGVLPTALTVTQADLLSLLRIASLVLGAGLTVCAFLVMSMLALRGFDAEARGAGKGAVAHAPVARARPGMSETAEADATRQAPGPSPSPTPGRRPVAEALPEAPAWLVDLADTYALTPRECDVAAYVHRGYSAKRTAELMGLTLNTVQSHTRNLYRKLGIHSRQDLIDLVDQGAWRR